MYSMNFESLNIYQILYGYCTDISAKCPRLGPHFSLESLFFLFLCPTEFAKFVPSVTSMWSATSSLHETPDSNALKI